MKGKVKQVTIITQEEYVKQARSAVELLRKQSVRLSEAAKFLSASPDFSPVTLDTIREVLLHNLDVVNECKRLEELTLKRGTSYYDEQKAKLFHGTLRVSRIGEDQSAAAE